MFFENNRADSLTSRSELLLNSAGQVGMVQMTMSQSRDGLHAEEGKAQTKERGTIWLILSCIIVLLMHLQGTVWSF